MKRLDVSAALLGVAALLYPLMALVLVRLLGPLWVVGGLCVLLILRFWIGWARKAPLALTLALAGVAGAMALSAAYDAQLAVRLYPAFMNAALLAAFAFSLARGPSLIERLARLHEPDLPPSGIRYTRRVTWVWAIFFAMNGAAALWTALFADWHVWTLYNGLIAYVAMAILFGGEFLIRQFVRKRAGA